MKMVWLADEAYISSDSVISTQNYRFWSSEPHDIVAEGSLHVQFEDSRQQTVSHIQAIAVPEALRK